MLCFNNDVRELGFTILGSTGTLLGISMGKILYGLKGIYLSTWMFHTNFYMQNSFLIFYIGWVNVSVVYALFLYITEI